MKKRLGKKLTLNKETVWNLSDSSLHEVAGGLTLTCAGGGCSGTDTIQQSECVQATCACTQRCTDFCTQYC